MIKKSVKNKKDKSLLYEEYYPYFFAIILGVVSVICLVCNIEIKDDINSILNAIISFASILIGFIGALFALIFSLKDNPIVNHILSDTHYLHLMKKYFKVAINSGFITILLTVFLFFRITISNIMWGGEGPHYIINIIKVFWVYSVTLFSLSSYRLISVVLKLSFASSGIDTEDEKIGSELKEEIDKMNDEIALDEEQQ